MKSNCFACKSAPPNNNSCWHDVAEKCNLEVVEEFDRGGSYEFDQFIIWKRLRDGRLFYGADSGCSCPSPFEGVDSIEDLNAITYDSWTTFEKEFGEYCKDKVDLSAETETLDKVRQLLKEAK